MRNLLHINRIGKGQPLVLLHGWGWHSGIWTPLIPYLSDKFELFIPDLPGFGKSPCLTSDYSFDVISNLLFDTIPDQAIWVGWSLGGMLAWHVAIHYPKKINKLITVAASPKFVRDENWPGVPSSVLKRFSTQLNNHYEATILDFLRLQLRGSDNEILFENLKKQLLPIDPAALHGGLNLLNETDFRADLAKITIPSVHIFGEMDALVPASVTPYIQSLIPNGQCEMIKRAGHIPFLSHPTEFTTKLISPHFM